MKKYSLSIIALLAFVALLPSCDDNDLDKRQVPFTATMPADDLSSSRPGSVINGVPAADGFNLNAQWKNGDKIQIFVRQDGRVYQVESPATVYDISSDGKTCSFDLVLPKSVKPDRDYEVIGVTGVEAYIDGEDVIALCTMKRVGIDSSNATFLPMWFTSKKGSNQAKFRHLCAYEVLNVRNNSESSITFRHVGYDVHTPWYKYSDKVVLTNSSRYETGDAGQTDAESNEITIASGATGTIVSWYIPRYDITDDIPDAPIDNARFMAVVNGNFVITNDALTAYKNFARGNAYYMEANWDGSTLYYSNEFCPDGNHPHMIDLGLPSGTKWACCNVGANSPAEGGNYFAWGETAPKEGYLYSNYKWFIGGDYHKITKYCSNSDYGTVDNIVGLELEDDAAYVNWGLEWRMPETAQFSELHENCTSEWTTVNGMGGYLFKSKTNDRAVFFPAAGWYNPYGFQELETAGNYWSRFNLYASYPYYAYVLGFRYGNMGVNILGIIGRQNGCSVRAVHVAQE
ncbi:MAG: hypothetical protein J5629_02800 [Muribaculaceae bacterium]|nr:hypothetical protein [Muribaculaceae bacterium]